MGFARKAGRAWFALGVVGWASVAGATASCQLPSSSGYWTPDIRGAAAGQQAIQGRIAQIDAQVRGAARYGNPYEASACAMPGSLTAADWARYAAGRCEQYLYDQVPLVFGTGVVPWDPVDITPDPSSAVRSYRYSYEILLEFISPTGPDFYGPVIGTGRSIPFTAGSCNVAPSVIGFFNGVTATEKEANANLNALKEQFGDSRDTTPLDYQVFYNQTGCGSGRRGGCLEDFVETFQQRDRELGGILQGRFETFWEVLQGQQEDPASESGQTASRLGKLAKAFLDLLRSAGQAIEAKVIATTAGLIATPPTAEDEASHLQQLIAIDDAKMGAVLVAHSQGNLFANTAYDAIHKVREKSIVRVVHVAPASPTLRGDYVLGDTDAVINGLRVSNLGTVPNFNEAIPEDPVDKLSHNFIATYMDPKRPGRAHLIRLIEPSLDAL